MHSVENHTGFGSDQQKVQRIRYPQLAIAILYTIFNTYLAAIFLRSMSITANLLVYGTAIGKPKTMPPSPKSATATSSHQSLASPKSDHLHSVKSASSIPRVLIGNQRSELKLERRSKSVPGYNFIYSEEEAKAAEGKIFPAEVQKSGVIFDDDLTFDLAFAARQKESMQCRQILEECQQNLVPCQEKLAPVQAPAAAALPEVHVSDTDGITPRDLATLANNCELVLILDCRAFTAYNAKHIVGAFNVACSDRITKKRLVDGKIRLVDAISGQEGKELYRQREGSAVIVIYDEETEDCGELAATHPLKLIGDCLRKQGKSARFLIGGLKAFHEQYANMCTSEESSSSIPLLFSPTSPELNVDIDTAVASEILPHLIIGNYRDASSLACLTSLGVTHVINVTANLPLHFEAEGIRYLRLPASDSGSQNLRQYFAEAIDFIDAARASKGRVLVHCQAGVSRSPTIVLAYLIARSQLSLSDAFTLVKDRRSIVAPNINFMGQLLEFEQTALAPREGLCPPSEPVHLLRV
jgi:dual specificity MAP kinase phosphatase